MLISILLLTLLPPPVVGDSSVTITVRVLDVESPVANAVVFRLEEDGEQERVGVTNDDGVLKLEAEVDHPLRLRVVSGYHSGEIEVPAVRGSRDEVVIRIRRSLTLRVTDERGKAPIEGATVSVFGSVLGKTTSDGTLTVVVDVGREIGLAKAGFARAYFVPTQGDPSVPLNVRMAPESVLELAFDTGQPRSISVVEYPEGLPGIARVTHVPEPHSSRVVVRELGASKVEILVIFEKGAFYSEIVTLVKGKRSECHVPAPAKVRGKVVVAEGSTLPAEIVIVSPDLLRQQDRDKPLVLLSQSSIRLGAKAAVDQEGSFELELCSPSSPWVGPVGPGQPLVARRCTIAKGSKEIVLDLRDVELAELSGSVHVEDASSKRAELFFAYPANEVAGFASAVTGEDGSFRVVLPVGNVMVIYVPGTGVPSGNSQIEVELDLGKDGVKGAMIRVPAN